MIPEHVSYSSWQLWRNCPQKWYLDVVRKLGQKVKSVHMDFGTAVHETIELMTGKSVEKRPADPSQYFEDKFKELLSENISVYREKERLDLSKPNRVKFFIDAGRLVIQRFGECSEIATAEVIYNEYRLMEKIDRSDDIPVHFKGFIDMVIKSKDRRGNTILWICDFKSCSWGWDREKRQNRELQFQLFLYKHFFCKRFNLDQKNVRCAFVLLKKRPPKGVEPVEFFPVSAGPVSVQRALDELLSDITQMSSCTSSGKFFKNRKFCENDFGDICPHLNTPQCTQ
jgi:hypothetical protein